MRVLGFGVVGAGAVIGLLIGNWVGLAVASVCVIVGLVLVVASEAQGLVPKPGGSKGKLPQVLVLVKEVHAYPQSNGKFQEIKDPNQADLELEVFVNCWVLLAAELSLRIVDIRLTLREAGGYSRVGERVSDLGNWHREVVRASEEESDLSEAKTRTPAVSLEELDTTKSLEVGAPREGWLHFRLCNATPAEFKTGQLELSVTDSLSHTHSAVAGKVRHLPGKIRPIPANSTSEVPSRKDEPPSVSAEKLAG